MCGATMKEIYFLSHSSALGNWLFIFTQPKLPRGTVVEEMRRDNIIYNMSFGIIKENRDAILKINAIGQKI